jgi:hemolysin activation/secretion protein
VLPQEVIDHSFTNAIGPRVSLAQIRHALGLLQLAYRERGLAAAEVALPRQTVTNGTVAVTVKEGKLVSTGQMARPMALI